MGGTGTFYRMHAVTVVCHGSGDQSEWLGWVRVIVTRSVDCCSRFQSLVCRVYAWLFFTNRGDEAGIQLSLTHSDHIVIIYHNDNNDHIKLKRKILLTYITLHSCRHLKRSQLKYQHTFCSVWRKSTKRSGVISLEIKIAYWSFEFKYTYPVNRKKKGKVQAKKHIAFSRKHNVIFAAGIVFNNWNHNNHYFFTHFRG